MFCFVSSFKLQLAKAAFQKNQDPLDASLYYLLLKKKNLLTHLFKASCFPTIILINMNLILRIFMCNCNSVCRPLRTIECWISSCMILTKKSGRKQL